MTTGSVKSSILALTATSAPDGWRHLSTGTRFVMSPCKGVHVTLRPGWTFKGWFAISQPSVVLDCDLISETFSAVLGRRPSAPPVRYLYQKIRYSQGRQGYRPSFWEDLPNRGKDERLVEDVPDYIAELVADYSRWVAPEFDFQDQHSFLRSLPQTYTYHGYPLQDDLCFLLTRCLLGDFAALDDFRNDPKIPTVIKQRVDTDLDRLQVAVPDFPGI